MIGQRRFERLAMHHGLVSRRGAKPRSAVDLLSLTPADRDAALVELLKRGCLLAERGHGWWLWCPLELIPPKSPRPDDRGSDLIHGASRTDLWTVHHCQRRRWERGQAQFDLRRVEHAEPAADIELEQLGLHLEPWYALAPGKVPGAWLKQEQERLAREREAAIKAATDQALAMGRRGELPSEVLTTELSNSPLPKRQAAPAKFMPGKFKRFCQQFRELLSVKPRKEDRDELLRGG